MISTPRNTIRQAIFGFAAIDAGLNRVDTAGNTSFPKGLVVIHVYNSS